MDRKARRIWVRGVRPDEMKRLVDWGVKGNNNYFDPDVLFYPGTRTFVAHAGEPVVYVPVQSVYMLDSLAINPDLTAKNAKFEVAVGLREILIALVVDAQRNGVGEIYFMGTNDDTNEFAAKFGFEELPWRAYRMKVHELSREKKNEDLPKSDPVA